MDINGEYFDNWTEKRSKKLSKIGKDLKSIINTNGVFDKDEKLFDNQELCFVLHISRWTLLRYRTESGLPYIKYGQKISYKAGDVREFINCNGDC